MLTQVTNNTIKKVKDIHTFDIFFSFSDFCQTKYQYTFSAEKKYLHVNDGGFILTYVLVQGVQVHILQIKLALLYKYIYNS